MVYKIFSCPFLLCVYDITSIFKQSYQRRDRHYTVIKRLPIFPVLSGVKWRFSTHPENGGPETGGTFTSWDCLFTLFFSYLGAYRGIFRDGHDDGRISGRSTLWRSRDDIMTIYEDSDNKPDIPSWSFLAFNPLPDGPLASPLTENGPRSDWT